MKTIYIPNIIILIILLMSLGCKKYLDERPSKNFRTISKLEDAQSLLDNYTSLNQSDIGAGEVSSDDYYLSKENYDQIEENYRRMYTWEKDYLFVPDFNDWNNVYKNIYLANSALELMPKVERTPENQTQWDNVKGQALFFRAWFFLQAAVTWAPAYHKPTANAEPGIPLRLNTNFNEPSVRASLQQTYQQIADDLKEAVTLLPVKQTALTRPSKEAALALLARISLYMGSFEEAAIYANDALKIGDKLLDFNSLVPSDEYPIKPFNVEVIFESYFYMPVIIANFYAYIKPDLYESYNDNDLRKILFFKPNGSAYSFYGSYEGNLLLFSGISRNELYLTRAEAYARTNKTAQAMEDLNNLLTNRWKIDPVTRQTLYVSQSASTSDEALNKILVERRKELLMRGLRWIDIKRLNRQGANINLERILNGTNLELKAGDPRFDLPIPEDIIKQTGISQNKR